MERPRDRALPSDVPPGPTINRAVLLARHRPVSALQPRALRRAPTGVAMPSTPSTPAGTPRSASVGRILIVIGGVLAALSSWVNWGAKTRQLGAARTAYTIPAKFVIDSDAGPG